jgi:hypothetical protein
MTHFIAFAGDLDHAVQTVGSSLDECIAKLSQIAGHKHFQFDDLDLSNDDWEGLDKIDVYHGQLVEAEDETDAHTPYDAQDCEKVTLYYAA